MTTHETEADTSLANFPWLPAERMAAAPDLLDLLERKVRAGDSAALHMLSSDREIVELAESLWDDESGAARRHFTDIEALSAWLRSLAPGRLMAPPRPRRQRTPHRR